MLDFLAILCAAIAVTSAQVLDCSEYIGHTVPVDVDGKRIEYTDIELYYVYDKDHLIVNEFPDEKSANLELMDNIVSFRGIVIDNNKIDNKYSIKAEKPVSTKTVGFARETKHRSHVTRDVTLSRCKFAVTIKPDEKSTWPRNLEKTILHRVSECLESELCNALGNINNIAIQ